MKKLFLGITTLSLSLFCSAPLMGGVVLAVAEALAVEGEEALLAAVFVPPQAARNRGRIERVAPYRSAL